MRLDHLLDASSGRPGVGPFEVSGAPTGVDVTSIVHDSKAVEPGSLFACVPGGRFDGHRFAAAAVDAGAVALLAEKPVTADVPVVRVASVRRALGPVASALYGDPSRHLDVVGVTGTNGKTTTVELLRSILEAAGRPCGLIGTLTGARTTPEAPELQALLASFVAKGHRAVAMEVSSHALVQERVAGTRFRVAVFTNLSQDHLDFHGTVETYFSAKARLFEPDLADTAVVNLDDPRGRLLRHAALVPTTGYALSDVDDLRLDPTGSSFRWRDREWRVGLAGRFNVENALAAATAAIELGIDDEVIDRGLRAAGPVPGRFELVDAGQPFAVVVDYAHTPDGLEQVLAAAREVTRCRVVVVFGAGGDRDRDKRPRMGAAAAAGADHLVLTNDNPRSEDPMTIIDAVRSGIPPTAELTIEPDRRAAIATALAMAGPGDLVMIAGKGHEDTQVVGDSVTPFDDRRVAREIIAAGGVG
jgi:UDP-N-acetylmuramoyl-L-alanyl-D-glutamate--2,6-diaminopimelate ligase